jgi:hypothetical protein
LAVRPPGDSHDLGLIPTSTLVVRVRPRHTTFLAQERDALGMARALSQELSLASRLLGPCAAKRRRVNEGNLRLFPGKEFRDGEDL